MSFWNPETLRAACAGTWVVRPPQIELPKDRPADLPPPPLHAPITGLSTDTRTLKPGQVYLALRGENHDGHAFTAAAVKAGSPILIIDDPACVPEGGRWGEGGEGAMVGVMKVADTGAALLRLAGAYRRTLERTRVVAVCGSNGKTTTTNLIAHLLSSCGLRGTASRKSYNNAVGVPLTILAALPTDQYLLCEVGTNAPGEIAQLADVVQPDVAVVTSIGREHLEKLGDLAGVAREEGAVFRFMSPKGCAVVNADVPELAEHAAKAPMVVSFGRSDSANFRLTSVRHTVDGGPDGGMNLGLEIVFNGKFTARLPLIGEHNAMNALAALAVARRFGLDEQKAIAALATATGPEMRLQVVRLDAAANQPGNRPVILINDAYNANPDSMIAGLRTLAAVALGLPERPRRTVAVLADMLELGDSTADSHAAVGRAIADLEPSLELVVLVGPAMEHAGRVLAASGRLAEGLVHRPSLPDAEAARVAAMLEPGDLVLLKGSRRMRLERVVDAARARFPGVNDTRARSVQEPKGMPPVVPAG